jgi:uncharacterized damage-inducible protein DinB
MNSSKLLSSLFAYKTWTNAAMYKVLLETASGPAADQWKDAIRMMNHMYVIDKIFAAHLTGVAHDYSSGNTPETPEIGALHEAVEAMDAWYGSYVSDLTAEQLAETIPFTFTDGLQGSMSREEILMHVITHGSYHRGAVGRMLAERGIATPQDTLTRSLHFAEPIRRTVQLPQ